jgi:hypothetical protein
LGYGKGMKKCAYCGRLSEDALTVCQECGTTLPRERFEIAPPRVPTSAGLRARRKALLDGIFWMVFSLGALAMGWLYPAWFLGRDPTMQSDWDARLRLGPAILFCLVVAFIFAERGRSLPVSRAGCAPAVQ